jgi:hypothetical protein
MECRHSSQLESHAVALEFAMAPQRYEVVAAEAFLEGEAYS